MGSWGGLDSRCHNAPQLWTMGWSTPALTLDLTALPPGAPAQLYGVPMQTNGPSGIKVSVNGSSFTVSYRGMRPPYDRPFLDLGTLSDALLVHRVPSGVQYTDTALVGMLSRNGDSWVEPQSLLSVTLISRDDAAGSATVAMCCRVSAGEPCYSPLASLEGQPAGSMPVGSGRPSPSPSPSPATADAATQPSPSPAYGAASVPLPSQLPSPAYGGASQAASPAYAAGASGSSPVGVVPTYAAGPNVKRRAMRASGF